MKKTYKKLESDLLLVETEGGFMGSSILLSPTVTVEPYQDGFADGQEGFITLDDGNKSFDVKFD